MTTARFLTAACIGAGMTLALFWLMQALIAVEPARAPQKDAPPPVITPVLPEEPPLRTVVRQRLEPLPTPPPRSSALLKVSERGIPVTVSVPAVEPAAFRPAADGFPGNDQPLVAIVRVSPAYPPSAARRELEGYVIVAFDVTEAGTVDNVRVLESSDAAFERSALDAARRFRFQPRVVDGVPVPAFGVRKLFRYRLDDG